MASPQIISANALVPPPSAHAVALSHITLFLSYRVNCAIVLAMKHITCLLLALLVLSAAMVQGSEKNENRRSWREVGKNLVSAVTRPKGDAIPSEEDSAVRFSLREGFTNTLHDYKEQLKEEGRAYARQLGDALTERIREDPKISSTLTTVKTLCWVVMAYLTLVTVFIVITMRRVKRDNARILALLERRDG